MHSNIFNLFRTDSDSIAQWSNIKPKDEMLGVNFSVNTVKITLRMLKMSTIFSMDTVKFPLLRLCPDDGQFECFLSI